MSEDGAQAVIAQAIVSCSAAALYCLASCAAKHAHKEVPRPLSCSLLMLLVALPRCLYGTCFPVQLVEWKHGVGWGPSARVARYRVCVCACPIVIAKVAAAARVAPLSWWSSSWLCAALYNQPSMLCFGVPRTCTCVYSVGRGIVGMSLKGESARAWWCSAVVCTVY